MISNLTSHRRISTTMEVDTSRHLRFIWTASEACRPCMTDCRQQKAPPTQPCSKSSQDLWPYLVNDPNLCNIQEWQIKYQNLIQLKWDDVSSCSRASPSALHCVGHCGNIVHQTRPVIVCNVLRFHGDELRARGTSSPKGSEMHPEEEM